MSPFVHYSHMCVFFYYALVFHIPIAIASEQDMQIASIMEKIFSSSVAKLVYESICPYVPIHYIPIAIASSKKDMNIASLMEKIFSPLVAKLVYEPICP